MTSVLLSRPVAELRTAVDGLLAAELSMVTGDDLLAMVREVEVETRRLEAVDHALIAELDRRGVAADVGERDTATMLRRMLRITPGHARARVRAATELGPSQTLTGQPAPPAYPSVAAAQAAGVISTQHASVITRCITTLPTTVADEHADAVEATLTMHAEQFDPQELAVLARRVHAHLNPDGVLTADRDHQRDRDARLFTRRDGSGQLTARLTPAALAVWRAVLDPLAAPAPADDGVRDPRSPGQRLHDGLLEAGLRLLRSGSLPDCGGTPVTVAVTVPLRELEARTGLVTTAHGGTLSVPELLVLAAEAEVIPVVLGDAGGVLAYGRARRTASPAQRRALAARDHGCSFPDCTAPPAWTQAHHVLDWLTGGPTDLDNLTLLCGHHHRTFERAGWACHMTDGVPHWTPPSWIDLHRHPRRNTRHRPEIDTG